MSDARLVSNTTVWYSEKKPSTNYWSKTGYLGLKNASGDRMYGYLYFALPFKPGVVIQSAWLTIKTRALAAMTNRTITVEALATGMNFSHTTWATAKDVTTKDAVTVTKSGALAENTTWSFNIGRMVQDFSDGQRYGGFRIRTNDPNLVLVQGHLMGAATAPVLTLAWSDAPLPPDTLSPSAGRVVGEAAPVLRFNFEDYSGNTSMQSCQVQLGSTSATKDWDSGEVSAKEPQLDLSATSWKPPAEGTPVYWRVRVRDGAGLWSGWSDPTSWVYHARPTITLVNPDSTGTVTDSTPPIDWAYKSPNGSAQDSFWLVIEKQTGTSWQEVCKSGRIPGTVTEWTPTVPIGKNGTYRVRLCVWDSWEREATAGVPVFVEVEQVFTFKAGSPAAPTGGTMTQVFPYPAVTLTWHSATEPDRWVVFCDGEPFIDYPGNALSKGGDLYGVTDQLVPPRKDHTYSIHAVQNGVASQPLNVRGQVKPLGTWIYSLDVQTKLLIVNDKERETTFTEDTGTYNVVGAHQTMVVYKSMRGYEGTLKGLLRAVPQVPNMDSEDWKAAALAIKSDIGARYWLAWGDECFQAVLADVQVARSTAYPDSYDFSCKFYQQANFDFEV